MVHHARRAGAAAVWSPWRTVVAFGLVSLFADMAYEGMRSVAGPFLGTLGASAAVVGLVTGAGEAVALLLRLVTGSLTDRAGAHWRATVVGYGLTAACVPLLAVAPFAGAAGLGIASALFLLERTGKAVRSPSKSALLAGMTRQVGAGRGFAVHKALDQVGALLGPLVVGLLIATTDATWPAFLALGIPGGIAMVLVLQLRRRAPRVPAPSHATGPSRAPTAPAPGIADAQVASVSRLPRAFYAMALGVAASTFGLMTFGVISFHLVEADLVPLAGVPLVYAAAMAVAALAALGSGWTYDRFGTRVLLLLPPAAALVAPLAFMPLLAASLAGILVWGLATGMQDSTVKAWVADLVPAPRLGTAYGVFAAFQGVAAMAGGTVAGASYAGHLPVLIALIAVLQVLALLLLGRLTRRR